MGLASFLPLPHTSFLMPSQWGWNVHASEKQSKSINWLSDQRTNMAENTCFELFFSQITSLYCSYRSTTKETVTVGGNSLLLSQINMLNKIRPFDTLLTIGTSKPCTRWVSLVESSREPEVKAHSLAEIQLFRKASHPEQVASRSQGASQLSRRSEQGGILPMAASAGPAASLFHIPEMQSEPWVTRSFVRIEVVALKTHGPQGASRHCTVSLNMHHYCC